MKVVIFCGGKGTRLSEETDIRPKPMVEIGEKPILWHIMSSYAQYGFKDFVLALGYKQEYIKEYFSNFHLKTNNYRINLETGKHEFLEPPTTDWNINLIDTGYDTLTGGRLLRLKEHLKDEETFMLTYGDGVSDIDIESLLTFHKEHGKIATMSAVRPPSRFGEMVLDGELVKEFKEKPRASAGWINGGFFVLGKEIFKYLDKGDETIFEQTPLQGLSNDSQLMAYKHDGFWQCMDTLRDKMYLNDIWNSKKATWIRN